MNRRGFLSGLLATVALTTGLARARLDLIDDDQELSLSEIITRTLRARGPDVVANITRSNPLYKSLSDPGGLIVPEPFASELTRRDRSYWYSQDVIMVRD